MKIRKPCKNDVYGGLLAVGMLCFVLLLQSTLYPPERLIKQAVSRMGYETEDLGVEQVSFFKSVYKSSIIVTDEEGREIEYWQISVMPYTQTVCYAKPYYDEVTV